MKYHNFDLLGYEEFALGLSTLLSLCPPPFIYVNDPMSPRTTSFVVETIIESVSDIDSEPSTKRMHIAKVNAVSCFSSRLLYDTILNSLANWNPRWEDGCVNWNVEGQPERWNENFDGFIHGLRALNAHICGEGDSSRRKAKQKELQGSGDGGDVRFVIVVERAERLKDNLPDLVVPLTRLAELSRLDLSVIFLSEVRWEDIRPPLGASPDPYFMDIPPLSKETVVQRIISKFQRITNSEPGPYHQAFKALYSHFVSVLCDVCFSFTNDPQELEYITAARWPGFVQPVLDEHQHQVELWHASRDEIEEEDADMENIEPELLPPSEDVRMRLSRLFKPSLTAAMEELYPRLTNAHDWARENQPPADLLAKHPGYMFPVNAPKSTHDKNEGMKSLPRMSKFILIAAFLASTNPAKSDIRMFGRGLDEKKRKRRVMKTSGKTKSGPVKIPQRLVGPVPFALDRVIAILGALLEENDVDSRPPAPEYTIPGEYTDMEIGRAGVYSSIMELTSMRLLHRTSHPDRIDGPPMFKCGISYDVTLALARQLHIPLNDLMWDPV